MEIDKQDALAETAAEWHARLGAADTTDDDRARCERWRRQDPAHEEAFARLERISRQFTRHAATDARLQLMTDRAFAMGSREISGRPQSRRRWQLPMTLAAGIAVALIGARFASSIIGGTSETAYFTASTERSDFTLSDGTVVHLDAASNVKIRMSHGERRVALLAGRAFFEVAHDAGRPFTVTANGEHVTALGTRFQVERQPKLVLVTLDQGSVSVTDESTGPGEHREILLPGEQLQIRLDDGVWTKRSVDTQAATSWSQGRLIFRATALADALEQVNRYTAKKVRLGDPALATLPVSGNFISGDSALAVSAITALLPLRAVDAGQEIVLYRRTVTTPGS